MTASIRIDSTFAISPSELDKVSMKPDGFAMEAVKVWLENNLNGLAEDFPARTPITLSLTIERPLA